MVRELSDTECNAVRSDAQRFLATRPDLSPADLSQYTTLAEPTMRMFLRGTIPGGREVIGEVRRVLGQAWAGDILAPGGAQAVVLSDAGEKRVRKVAREGKFYETQTVRRVAEVMDYCAEHCAIGVITADFGVGKTEAVRAWRRGRGKRAECAVLEFNEFSCADKVQFCRELCRNFDLPISRGSQFGGQMFTSLVDHLRENPVLLVFDQCETLRPRVCQVIRQLWDRTADAGVGVVMLAAPILLARMMAAKMQDLGALTSRVGIWAPLSGLTRGEMAAIVKQEGFDDVDEAAFVLWYQAVNGSMRRLMRSVDLLKAKYTGKRITEKTIEGVAGHLWGMNLGRAS